MDYTTMTVDQLTERRAAIAAECDAEGADLDALLREAEGIKAELETRKANEAKKAELRAAVAGGAGEPVKTFHTEEMKMDNKEIRNSADYVNAYAEYIKTGDDRECRALLTTNYYEGTVAVPDFVYDIIKTAWDKNEIMSRVRKSYLKGNLKVGYEVYASDAVEHAEGMEVAEEQLVLGTIELIPVAFKKWVSFSDEAFDLRGEAFLRYIYDEIAHKITKAEADYLINAIFAASSQSSPENVTTIPPQDIIESEAITMATVAEGIARLSDEAANPVVIMNKLTYAEFKRVQYANGYGADPFEGLPVIFSDKLDAFRDNMNGGDQWLIVGDLGHGALANYPNGDEIGMKYDDMTLATSDLVRVIGRQFVALNVVAPKSFVVYRTPLE